MLQLVIQLANAHAVSLLDVHQGVSTIINKFSDDRKFQDWFRGNSIFYSLLSLSSIEQMTKINNETKLLSDNNIEIEFEKKIHNLQRLSTHNLFE